MPRATTKAELLRAASAGFDALNAMIDGMTGREHATPFDFSQDKGKKQAHWRRDRDVKDVVIHLAEWHNLLLSWVAANRQGLDVHFLPAPYNWKTYGQMNVQLRDKHADTTLSDAREMLARSHAAVMALADTFTQEELFTVGAFPWVGGSVLGSYFVSNLGSHYDWAMTKLKAHRKRCAAL